MVTLRNIELEILRFHRRLAAAALVVAIGLLLIAARAAYLQIWRYDAMSAQAEGNRTAIEPIAPVRGDIYDRGGNIVARNHATYGLEIIRSETPDLDETIHQLRQIVTLNDTDILRFKRRARDATRREPVMLRKELSGAELARFAAQKYALPGVNVRAMLVREYPLGATAGHLLGYLGRISLADRDTMLDWPDEDQANYRGTSEIGKRGLERSYERDLHGTAGYLRMETSARGIATRELERVPAQSGRSLGLTIDMRLQQLVERLYGERRGALVALQPQTGEVLAMVSMPTFDPNLFVGGIDTESWRSLNESIDRPLLNRALNGTYPPGSTYKPFMALLALSSGKRGPKTTISDPGYWMLGEHKFRSHGDTALGPVNLRTSLVQSSNVYYYSLAYELGIDAIHAFMEPFGFGQRTGIDLEGESRGILPSKEWKAQAFGGKRGQWYPGDTVSLGIGQGFNSFTVLQLATATSALANGGFRVTPHLVRAESDAQAGPVDLGLNPQHLAWVKQAMVDVTREGTSRAAFAGAPYLSAGKTGTAQAVTISQTEKYDAAKMEERQRDHSLYIAFAPADNPQIALAAIVENAGFGSTGAAPIARRVFDYWLLNRYPSEEDIQAVAKGRVTAPVGEPRDAQTIPLAYIQRELEPPPKSKASNVAQK